MELLAERQPSSISMPISSATKTYQLQKLISKTSISILHSHQTDAQGVLRNLPSSIKPVKDTLKVSLVPEQFK